MNIWIVTASAATLALSGCNEAGLDEANRTASDVAGEPLNEAEANNMASGEFAGTPSSQDYVATAAASDLYEIEGARLALTKTANADVKALAEMIKRDHEKSTADLRTAAGQSQPPLAMDPQMNAEQQANLQALRATQGSQFDATYLEQQVAAHEKALAMGRNYAQNGDAPALQRHAAEVAGPVERHLEQAMALLQTMQQ